MYLCEIPSLPHRQDYLIRDHPSGVAADELDNFFSLHIELVFCSHSCGVGVKSWHKSPGPGQQ